MKIIIGQEAICPDGLGRVAGYSYGAAGSLSIQVDTYIRNRGCIWDARNVELIPPYTDKQLQSENATLKADLAALREVEREKVAAWILSFGFATGHGDTIEDLLSEAGTQIQELRAAQEWVPVSERLPESEITVITLNTYHPLAPVGPAQYSDGIWLDLEVVDRDSAYEELPCVTHWMPLPAPPEPTA